VLKAVIENKNHTGNGTDPVPAALEIVARGMVSPSELPTVHTASAAIWNRGGPRTAAEALVCRFAANTVIILPTDDRPTPPAELFQRIDELAAIHADKLAAKRQALDALVLARQEGARDANRDRAAARIREAEMAWRDADDEQQKTSSRLTRARVAVDNWRHQQALIAHEASIKAKPRK
jgi:hypothetical protein